MRRILVGLMAIALAFTMVGPTVAAADVTNLQLRTYGAEAWFTNMNANSPKGLYYDAYVQAFVAQDSRAGMSVDWVFFGYQVWEKRSNGDWAFRSNVSGYAPDGAAGLSMSVGDLAWATVKTSFPVGYCDTYEPEDAGGDCIRYVNVGTVDIDLAWTPTSGLLSWNDRHHQVVPAEWLQNDRRTSHYRDAALTGQVTFPKLGKLGVASQDGLITRYGIGEHVLEHPAP